MKAATAALLLALSDADRRLLHTVDVPNDAGRPLYHAGGVQRLGDVIAVASESQENFSIVTFVDAQRLVKAGEAVEIARPIRRTNNDAMAVGVTDITLNGETKWLAGVYQKGTIDVYLHPDILDTTIEWEHRSAVKVKEQNHQSFLLFAEAQAAGSDDPTTHNAYLFQPERGPAPPPAAGAPPAPAGGRGRGPQPDRRRLVHRHQVLSVGRQRVASFTEPQDGWRAVFPTVNLSAPSRSRLTSSHGMEALCRARYRISAMVCGRCAAILA